MPKRQHKTLNLAQKCEILKKLDSGVSGKQLAYTYGVGTSTISDIKNRKDKILSYVSSTSGKITKRRTLKPAEYPEMETKLNQWFLQQRKRNAPISEELLVAKAKKVFCEVYGPERGCFNASRGWILKFRKRYGIRNIKISGEKLSNNPEAVDPFKKNFLDKIKELNLSPCQIYNADESGLYWRLLPDKTLVSSGEKTAPGRKVSKERVTFLACTNASGTHMVKLLVIGKSRKPRSFGSVELPVQYEATSNAWMTSSIFRNWFTKSFVPQVRKHLRSHGLPEKALLILDNAPSHPPQDELVSEDGAIISMFLPPNCTALIQPLDQNIIRLTKLHYKKSLLSHILTLRENDIGACLKKITLRDAIFFLANAWEKIKPDVVEKCWTVLLSPNLDEWDSEDELPLHLLRERLANRNLEMETFQLAFQNLSATHLTQEDINDWIEENIEEQINEISSEEEGEHISEQQKTKIKHEEGIAALSTSLDWAIENEVPSADVLCLYRLREKALNLQQSKLKQSSITNYIIVKR